MRPPRWVALAGVVACSAPQAVQPSPSGSPPGAEAPVAWAPPGGPAPGDGSAPRAGSDAIAEADGGPGGSGARAALGGRETLAPESVPAAAAAPESDSAASAPAGGGAGVPPSRVAPLRCTYEIYNWSVEARRAVQHRHVDKPYADVAGDERSPDDPRCTVCAEDQVRVDLAALGFTAVDAVTVCWAVADQVRAAFAEIAAEGSAEIASVVGYRPGRTRGRIEGGLRMEMSNHAWGAAIDINAEHNGLYRDCDIGALTEEALERCTLSHGGVWSPSARPRTTIAPGGVIHRVFAERVGWRWGGEIAGGLRDLMHFSPSGI